MPKLNRYRVVRRHYGDKAYVVGDIRDAAENEVAHLVPHVLELVGPAAFDGKGDHYQNFADAVRAGDPRLLAADVREGHLSAALCHLGNESLRHGTAATLASSDSILRSVPELSEGFSRMQQHLERQELPSFAPLRLGSLLRPDADGNRHARRAYRAPFELKPQVGA